MKKVITLVLLTTLLMSCNIVKGNGKITTEDRSFNSFNKIDVSGATEINYHYSPDFRIEIKTDSNLMELLKTDVRNGVLHIYHEGFTNVIPTQEIVDIYCQELKDIELSGATKFNAFDQIKTSDLGIKISGSANVTADIDSDNLEIKISGSGKFFITGESKTADISISGSGNINGEDFKTIRSDVSISGSGKVTLNVEESLHGSISGSGRIYYRGNATTSLDLSGSGKIEKLD